MCTLPVTIIQRVTGRSKRSASNSARMARTSPQFSNARLEFPMLLILRFPRSVRFVLHDWSNIVGEISQDTRYKFLVNINELQQD